MNRMQAGAQASRARNWGEERRDANEGPTRPGGRDEIRHGSSNTLSLLDLQSADEQFVVAAAAAAAAPLLEGQQLETRHE